MSGPAHLIFFLVLRDVEANLVVDLIPNAIP